MKIYRNIDTFISKKFPVVTLGTFDGVHLGHQKILNRITEEAKLNNGESIVITFDPHPRMVLKKAKTGLSFINTIDEKIELLEKANIDNLIIINFTKEFSQLTSEEFIKQYLIDKLKIKKLIVGHDHHFGRDRMGDCSFLSEMMQEFKFDCERISAQKLKAVEVSSTKIREALKKGEIQKANSFLGYCYSITGSVKSGNKIGREIGFPTANIEIKDKSKLIPKIGIYAIKIDYEGKRYNGMAYIGKRPTFNLNELRIETNIFNFDKNIYNKEIKFSFVQRIRDDVKFNSIDELEAQLILDKKAAEQILNL
ncbi:MAG: bifunctional riboflavin kinase/FAD synthetase [Saprospiraceae bacterium]|nr:bifunctional riboflavin kinase/FAD synthetase [Saprospiraceae bacterium]